MNDPALTTQTSTPTPPMQTTEAPPAQTHQPEPQDRNTSPPLPTPNFPSGVQTIPLNTRNPGQSQRDEIRYEILRHLGTLATNARGWSKEVNLVSWNDRPARLDIRDWNVDHRKMSRGVNFDVQEARQLKRIMDAYEPGDHQLPEN